MNIYQKTWDGNLVIWTIYLSKNIKGCFEPLKPRSQETLKPRNQETNKTKTKKPRNQKPRNQETKNQKTTKLVKSGNPQHPSTYQLPPRKGPGARDQCHINKLLLMKPGVSYLLVGHWATFCFMTSLFHDKLIRKILVDIWPKFDRWNPRFLVL